MGQKFDKMDENLMESAPLENDIIEGLYFMHDAYRIMKVFLLVCEKIIKPDQQIDKNQTSGLEDLGNILVAAGISLPPDDVFSKILFSFGEIELNLAVLDKNWMAEFEKRLVRPISISIEKKTSKLTSLRNELMMVRLNIHTQKSLPNDSNIANALSDEYAMIKQKIRDLISKERKSIEKIKQSLIEVLELQLEMNKNSADKLKSYMKQLQTNPESIKIKENLNNEEIERALFNVHQKYIRQMEDSSDDDENEAKLSAESSDDFNKLSEKIKNSNFSYQTVRLFNENRLTEN